MDEEEATNLMATFKTSYPKIQTFIDRTLEQCRAKGYVEVALVYIFDKAILLPTRLTITDLYFSDTLRATEILA